MKFKSNKEEHCPICNSNNLEYGAMNFETVGAGYIKWVCKDCKAVGEEWFELNFIGHSVEVDDEMIEIEDNMIEKEEVV